MTTVMVVAAIVCSHGSYHAVYLILIGFQSLSNSSYTGTQQSVDVNRQTVHNYLIQLLMHNNTYLCAVLTNVTNLLCMAWDAFEFQQQGLYK